VYFKSPSGSVAQFSVPDEVDAAGHVYDVEVPLALVVGDGVGVAVELPVGRAVGDAVAVPVAVAVATGDAAAGLVLDDPPLQSTSATATAANANAGDLHNDMRVSSSLSE
jgi:hypothetical protein